MRTVGLRVCSAAKASPSEVGVKISYSSPSVTGGLEVKISSLMETRHTQTLFVEERSTISKGVGRKPNTAE
jgi:hypothetical protein